MGIFKKSEDNDIHCIDRTLKNMIDCFYQEKPEWDGDYEPRVTFLVEEGIKYRTLLKKLIAEAYEKHQKDITCDIPDYKTFLSLEQTMLDTPLEYQNKSVCVEGYICAAFCPHGNSEWRRDNAALWIYPVPCRSEVEKEIVSELTDSLRAISYIQLVSDVPLPIESGIHIRVHGTPCFYKALDDGCPSKVNILVKSCEILQ